MKNTKNPNNAIVMHNIDNVKDFSQLKALFVTSQYTDGTCGIDKDKALLDLAQAIAYSVLAKVLDPQRKNAVHTDKVSNGGYNPALLAVRRGIAHDMALLNNTADMTKAESELQYNASGDCITVIADKSARDAVSKLQRECLSDGIDIVQTACLALLEEYEKAKHRTITKEYTYDDGYTEVDTMQATNYLLWLDEPYTVKQLDKRVYINDKASCAYKNIDITPMQVVYRTLSKLVLDSKAVQANSKYIYVEDITIDGMERIYKRLDKYCDLGGYAVQGGAHMAGAPIGHNTGSKQFTADIEVVNDYDNIILSLRLTDRQLQILKLRMRGYGCEAIATYLGVTKRAVQKTMLQVQKKAITIGLHP